MVSFWPWFPLYITIDGEAIEELQNIKVRTAASDPEYDGLIKKQVAGG